MGLRHVNFGLPRPFHSQVRSRHATDGQTDTAPHFIMLPTMEVGHCLCKLITNELRWIWLVSHTRLVWHSAESLHCIVVCSEHVITSLEVVSLYWLSHSWVMCIAGIENVVTECVVCINSVLLALCYLQITSCFFITEVIETLFCFCSTDEIFPYNPWTLSKCCPTKCYILRICAVERLNVNLTLSTISVLTCWIHYRLTYFILSRKHLMLRSVSRVPTSPEKSWYLSLDFSGPEKSWNWIEVMEKVLNLASVFLKNQVSDQVIFAV